MQGLVQAVKEILPNAEHRQCARHIFANFRKRFSGAPFENLFWKASKSSTEVKFYAAMEEIKKLNPAAYLHLMEREPKTWSRAFFKVGLLCDSVENGNSESFNNVLDDARKKPLITMLEDLRLYVMERMYHMRIRGETWNRFAVCPKIREKINKLKYWQRLVNMNLSPVKCHMILSPFQYLICVFNSGGGRLFQVVLTHLRQGI